MERQCQRKPARWQTYTWWCRLLAWYFSCDFSRECDTRCVAETKFSNCFNRTINNNSVLNTVSGPTVVGVIFSSLRHRSRSSSTVSFFFWSDGGWNGSPQCRSGSATVEPTGGQAARAYQIDMLIPGGRTNSNKKTPAYESNIKAGTNLRRDAFPSLWKDLKTRRADLT